MRKDTDPACVEAELFTRRTFPSGSSLPIHLPKLLLQGESDTMAPPLMARWLYDAAPDPKQMALIPGGGHEDSAVVNATAYFAALNGFLSQYGFKR